MPTCQYGDLTVCTSILSQRAHRAAPCDLLALVTLETVERVRSSFRAMGSEIGGLRISGVADLSFLADFPNLRYLEILHPANVNTHHLHGLTNLRGLRLHAPGSGLDFRCFPELEVFIGDWHPDNHHLHHCDELRELRIWHFKPRSRDCQEIGHLTRLERLALTQTNITSLAGLDTLPDLRDLKIAYAPQLTTLDAFTAQPFDLREFELQKVKKVTSYTPITSLHRLRRLWLSDCAPMPNLHWTRSLTQLDFFSFVETNVEDGDLSPLLELPRLRYVGTMDKRHYNHKFHAINQLLRERFERTMQSMD